MDEQDERSVTYVASHQDSGGVGSRVLKCRKQLPALRWGDDVEDALGSSLRWHHASRLRLEDDVGTEYSEHLVNRKSGRTTAGVAGVTAFTRVHHRTLNASGLIGSDRP